MMLLRLTSIGLGLSMLLLLSSCSSSQGIQNSNTAYLYNPQNMALRPHFVVHHLSDTLSRIHYRMSSSDLLYVRKQGDKGYSASFRLRYEVATGYENATILDTNEFLFRDRASAPPEKIISGHFDVRTPSSSSREKDYILIVRVKDEKRGSTFQNILDLHKKSIQHRQRFILTDPDSNLLYKNHIPPGVPFRLRHPSLQPASYYLSVYRRDFPLATPPFADPKNKSFKIAPDTTYKVSADQPLKLPEQGLYHFRLDTSQWKGFTIQSFYREFPYVANIEQMGPPLRYLTKQEEYDQWQQVKNSSQKAKKWVDEFWLSRAANAKQGQKLIETYYRRVEYANRYFSSYLEGWKTDRGILYVVYGPPNKVYPTSRGETWVYGSESSSLSYIFNFEQVKNPFTDKDYELIRNRRYRYGWGQAVQTWRNGRTYDSENIRREQDAQDQVMYNRRRSAYWY